MRNVALSEAKDRLSEFVTAAQAGDEIVIMRHGKAAAKVVAVTDQDLIEARARGAWDRLKAMRDVMRAEGRTATMAEMIAWKNEGRP